MASAICEPKEDRTPTGDEKWIALLFEALTLSSVNKKVMSAVGSL